MKKFLILIGALALTLTLTGCSNDVEELLEIPETVTMDTVDDFLGRPDVQYVDLRNFDDKMKSGYISGFEMIPFFDYLEATDILVRTDMDWDFAAEEIHSQSALNELFDADRTIFLMCGSGTRAGYVLAALESLGFENVINVGGIADYDGDAMVTGDGSYNIEVQLPLPTVVDMDNIDMYLGRNDVQYVDLRNFDDKMKSGYIAGFEFLPFFDYMEFADVLVRTNLWNFSAADIVSESGLRGLFNPDKAIFLMCGSGTRAGYVKAALESLGYTNVYNVGGMNDYDGDYNVLGDGVFSNLSTISGDYNPGVHYGDSGSGYMAVIVVNANGGIENVTFDAISCTEIKVDDGTGTMISQDPKEYSSCTTKQTLGFDYNMVTYSASTLEWFEQANLLAGAIVANQGWVTGWELVVGTSHTYFGATDAEVIADGIAGVSIGIEGFQAALEDALTNATPAS